MKLNPPRHVRALLYLLATFGAPLLVWATAENWLDGPTEVLLAAVLTIIGGLAVANTVTPTATRKAPR